MSLPNKIEKKIVEAREAAADSIDGFKRTKNLEERINLTCRNLLNGPEGDFLMDYLKSITTQVVLPHTASDAELRMMEGQRRLVGILDVRRRTTPKET